MGSEQSSQANPSQASRIGQLRRGKSVPESKLIENDNVESSRPGSISPGPSVCSDSDLPYISYTVNRPIGDSPKLAAKQHGQLMRGKSLGGTSGILSSPGRRVGLRKSSSIRTTAASPVHNIVIVKHAQPQETTDKDSDILHLQLINTLHYGDKDVIDQLVAAASRTLTQSYRKYSVIDREALAIIFGSIPMFLPIMRGTLNLPAARDPEILERLDPGALYRLCFLYQAYLHQCATIVADDQTIILHKIKEVDSEVSRFMQLMSERQKTFAKYAERFSKVSDLSHQLSKCHLALNHTLDTLETLNNALPANCRLEPFVWTTG